MKIISLLTDFGVEDAYVAQMKGQILSVCPDVNIVDATHSVPPQDILAGAFLLSQTVPYFPSGTVHVAIVDPGVGTDRSMLAIELRVADSTQRIVLPDNGLITLLLAEHELVGANYLTNKAFWRPSVSHTFHGRDIMGPVAAHWVAGALRTEFGPPCSSPVEFDWPQPDLGENSVSGQPILLDHYGNVITNISARLWPRDVLTGKSFSVEIDGRAPLRVPLVETYGQAPAGQPVLLFGSHGYLELAVPGGSAATKLGLSRSSKITMRT